MEVRDATPDELAIAEINSGLYAFDVAWLRSRIAASTDDPPVPAPQVRPDQGHGTSRIAVGGGRRDGANFVELRARPTYHDLMDPDAGYVRGAQIEYLDIAVRDYSGAIGALLSRLYRE